MKKLLVGLIVLVALLAMPMAVSAGTTAEVNANIIDQVGLNVSGGVETWDLVFTMSDELVLDEVPTVNALDDQIVVKAYATNDYDVGVSAAANGGYLTDTVVSSEQLRNPLQAKTNVESGTGVDDALAGWGAITSWAETGAFTDEDVYSISVDQQVEYGELKATNGYQEVITFSITLVS